MTTRELGLHAVAEIQRAFDDLYWTAPRDSQGKRHHILLHLVGLVGKFAKLEERAEHGEGVPDDVLREMIPDLLIYATQLADLQGYDLPKLYRERLRGLAETKNPEDPWQGSNVLRQQIGESFVNGRKNL